jgi:hypothetical protein
MKIQKSKRLDISNLMVREILPKVQLIENIAAFDKDEDIEAKFDIELNPSFSLSNNVIKIELAVTIDLKHKNDDYDKVGIFAFEFLYTYEGLKELVDEQGIPEPEIFVTCANISYSTLRGIIYAKASNTCLNNILLPIIKGDELMKSMKA